MCNWDQRELVKHELFPNFLFITEIKAVIFLTSGTALVSKLVQNSLREMVSA